MIPLLLALIFGIGGVYWGVTTLQAGHVFGGLLILAGTVVVAGIFINAEV